MKRPSSPAYGNRTLQIDPPCKGRDVWELQIKLIAWGSGSRTDNIGAPYMPVVVNGTFDAATRAAVKRFQQALNLPITGIVDPSTFRAIDGEAALYAVMAHTMQCPCILPDPLPIMCRCEDHYKKGTCSGFGHGQFSGKYLLDKAKLPDGTSLSGEKLDVYDMREYPGMDKALLWAVRGLMRRANVDRIFVSAGYRCWQDNYRHPDERRWRHRRATFFFGKSLEFYHDLTCANWPANPILPPAVPAPCAICVNIRRVAVELCGFQPRWQEADRVSVGEVAKDAPAPANLYAVHVSTVRRRGRETDDFVKTFSDSLKPVYPDKLGSYSLPVDLGAGVDWRTAPASAFYANTETGPGGWFPIGPNRLLHTGIHLFGAPGAAVYAIADGEVVACRAGEAETAQPYGSRNFVLLRHKLKKKVWYSLYMHLDNGPIGQASAIGWRKKMGILPHEHIEMDLPAPILRAEAVAGPGVPPNTTRLVALPGLKAGDWMRTGGAAPVNPRSNAAPPLDPNFADNSQLVQLLNPAIVQNTYACVQLEGVTFGRVVAADNGIAARIAANDPFGIGTPIPVRAGEQIGSIAAAATDAVLNTHQSFLHLEAFSTEALLSGDGYTTIDATDTSVLADRKALYDLLLSQKLISRQAAGVILPGDLNPPGAAVDLGRLRSVIVKTKSAWNVNWKYLLNASSMLRFMTVASLNAMGDDMNQYRWWSKVSRAAGLPDLPEAAALLHYHPIVLLLQLAQEAQ